MESEACNRPPWIATDATGMRARMVWARVDGYPWWPAEVRRYPPRVREGTLFVRFFGTDEVASMKNVAGQIAPWVESAQNPNNLGPTHPRFRSSRALVAKFAVALEAAREASREGVPWVGSEDEDGTSPSAPLAPPQATGPSDQSSVPVPSVGLNLRSRGASGRPPVWLQTGQKVEVALLEEGLVGSRYLGRILRGRSDRPRPGFHYVEFDEMLKEDGAGGHLREWMPAAQLRPIAPAVPHDFWNR